MEVLLPVRNCRSAEQFWIVLQVLLQMILTVVRIMGVREREKDGSLHCYSGGGAASCTALSSVVASSDTEKFTRPVE